MTTIIEGDAVKVATPDHGIRETLISQGSVVIVCICGWNTPHFLTETEAKDRCQAHSDECYAKA